MQQHTVTITERPAIQGLTVSERREATFVSTSTDPREPVYHLKTHVKWKE